MRVFVIQKHGGCGVVLVPKGALEDMRADGYREATAAEIAGWYRMRGLRAPAAVLDQAREQPLKAPVVFGLSEGEPATGLTQAA